MTAARPAQTRRSPLVDTATWAVAGALYLLMVLVTLPTLSAHAGGLTALDLRGPYGLEEARELFEALGSQGRAYYARVQLAVDTIFPGAFALAAWMSLERLLGGLGLAKGRWGTLRWLPVLAGGLDYLENACVLMLLRSYPQLPAPVAVLAGVVTVAKSVLVSCLFVVLATLWAARARQAWRRTRA